MSERRHWLRVTIEVDRDGEVKRVVEGGDVEAAGDEQAYRRVQTMDPNALRERLAMRKEEETRTWAKNA